MPRLRPQKRDGQWLCKEAQMHAVLGMARLFGAWVREGQAWRWVKMLI